MKVESMAKKTKRKNFFDENIYKDKRISDLILLTMYLMERDNKKSFFERLLKECFILFPKVFSFSEYPHWPDSRKIDRPLRTLRKRKLVTGTPRTYFSLTASGAKIAEEVLKSFKQKTLKFK